MSTTKRTAEDENTNKGNEGEKANKWTLKPHEWYIVIVPICIMAGWLSMLAISYAVWLVFQTPTTLWSSGHGDPSVEAFVTTLIVALIFHAWIAVLIVTIWVCHKHMTTRHPWVHVIGTTLVAVMSLCLPWLVIYISI